MEWKDCDTLKLIELYEANEFLWNSKHADYRNRLKKNVKFGEFSVLFGCEPAEIQRKIHNLRNQVSHELQKLRKRKSGAGSDEVEFVSSWKFFNALKFVIPTCMPTATESNLDVGLGLECKAEGNLTGVCTKIADCPLVNFNVSASKICSYDGKVLIICCVRTSELACNGYNIVNGSLLKKSEENTNNNTVIKIQHRQYPRIVTIGWTQDDGNIRWNCRGSLISDRYLIASAQCSTFEGIAPDKISVRTENSSADLGEGLRTESNISSIIVHPDYKALSKYHDIALFKIDPIENLSALMPICLWPSKKLPFSAPLSMIFSEAGLHETSVSSVLQHSCARSFTLPIKSIPDGLIHSQICVQAKDRTLDICDDPNDGLLQLHTISSIADSAEYLVAVAPFDATCSQSTKMFTRIQSYLDWIEPIVWPEYYS